MISEDYFGVDKIRQNGKQKRRFKEREKVDRFDRMRTIEFRNRNLDFDDFEDDDLGVRQVSIRRSR